jgi:dTDP-4-amino-4,6-dideoxygalactose transaminase
LLLPETEKLTQKVLQLPTGTALGEKEIEQICAIIRLAFDNVSEIQDHLKHIH